MLKLATWNVNSLTVRIEQVIEWFNTSDIDILALQETKIVDELFPLARFNDLGFHVSFAGQKTYNGVAIISRLPIDNPQTDIPQLEDPQRRILAVTIGSIRLINLYVPNGSAVGSDKYEYKLNWLEHVKAFIQQQLMDYPQLAVVGDFNIAPADIDVHDPKAWEGSVLFSLPERKALEDIMALGLYDSYRKHHPEEPAYSWWDYRAASFRRNRGLRIDHIFLSNALLTVCQDSGIDVSLRRNARPSDHAPVWVALDL